MRTEAIYVVPDGRDQGKTFHIQEASAMRVEDWCMRAISAVARAGGDIGAMPDAGTSALQTLMVSSVANLLTMSTDDQRELLAEMLAQATLVPDPKNMSVRRPIMEDDIDDLKTLLLLRSEIVKLHSGFSLADAASKRMSASPSGQTSS